MDRKVTHEEQLYWLINTLQNELQYIEYQLEEAKKELQTIEQEKQTQTQ